MVEGRTHSVVHKDGDEGSIMPLIAIFAAIALGMVLVAASASSLYLERTRLYGLADAAALSAAESYDLAAVTVVDGQVRATLDSAAVDAAVREHLAMSPASASFDALTVVRAETTDGRSATVSLASVWHPPVLSPLMPDGVRVEVTSTARSVFQ